MEITIVNKETATKRNTLFCAQVTFCMVAVTLNIGSLQEVTVSNFLR